MASNKNQHFVPKCYLRPFTLDGEGAAINVYNLDRKKIIPNAPVKNQCSSDYFYGQDEQLEKATQSLEQAYAAVLRETLKPGCKLTQGQKEILQIFWLFQHLRTEGAGRRAAKMFNDMIDPVNAAGAFSLNIKEAVQSAMHVFAECMHSVSDLKICLLKNSTNVPFVTSDDPAVLTNRWQLEDKRTRGGSLGLRDAGAIILLPLSPRLYCIGYDADVYRIPSDDGSLMVRQVSDVESLNEFQLLNCRANLFLKDLNYADELHKFVRELCHRRSAERHRINFAVFDGVAVGTHKKYQVVPKSEFIKHNDGIMHAETIYTSPTKWPSFLLRRNKSCAYYNGTGLGYLRRAPASLIYTDRPFLKISPYKS